MTVLANNATIDIMKNHIKLTKKQRKQLVPFVERAREIEDRFIKALSNLERIMELETGIEGIEFFICDGSIVGIGNCDRTMKLIHLEDIGK